MNPPKESKITGHSVEEVRYPQTFDLRVIHLREGAEAIHADIAAILDGLGISFAIMQTVRKEDGVKYAKTGVRVTVKTKEEMDSMYKAIAGLPYVKALI